MYRHLKKLNSFVIIFSILLLSVSLNTSPVFATDKTYKWKIGTLVPKEVPVGAAMFEFADLVKERSGGKIQMDCFPVQQLGDWKDQFDNVMRGVQDLGVLPSSPRYQQFAARFIPFAVTSWEDYEKAYAPGGFMSELVTKGSDQLGIKVLAHMNAGFDGYSGMKGPVVLPTDIKKLNIKTRVGFPTCVPYFQKLGPVVSIDMGEVFTALQLGTIDCQADMAAEPVYTGFRDVTKYFTDINTMPAFLDIIMNKELWESLPKDLQDIVQKTATEVAVKATRLSRETENSYYDKFEKAGVVVTRLTPDQRNEWVKLAQQPDGLWNQLRKSIGDETIDWLIEKTSKP